MVSALLFYQCFSPYLQASKREALADYSLPMAVITVSFIGSYFFGDVECKCCAKYYRHIYKPQKVGPKFGYPFHISTLSILNFCNKN